MTRSPEQQPFNLPDESQVAAFVRSAHEAIAKAVNSEHLKQVRNEFAGDKSMLVQVNRRMGRLSPEQRKAFGQLIGQARARINQAITERRAEIAAIELASRLAAERVDVTLPVEIHPQGAMHPVSSMIERMSDVFVSLGWEVVEGPELEAEWLNFDSLNIPASHPARGLTDTLFIDPVSDHKLLRTQTSPVQMRTLLSRKPPVYIVSPGKVYRADEYDATHLPMFHQIEGLVVDEGITMGHLKYGIGTITAVRTRGETGNGQRDRGEDMRDIWKSKLMRKSWITIAAPMKNWCTLWKKGR